MDSEKKLSKKKAAQQQAQLERNQRERHQQQLVQEMDGDELAAYLEALRLEKGAKRNEQDRLNRETEQAQLNRRELAAAKLADQPETSAPPPQLSERERKLLAKHSERERKNINKQEKQKQKQMHESWQEWHAFQQRQQWQQWQQWEQWQQQQWEARHAGNAGAVPAMAAATVAPAGAGSWLTCLDQATGRAYYYNAQTQQSSWTWPPQLEAPSTPPRAAAQQAAASLQRAADAPPTAAQLSSMGGVHERREALGGSLYPRVTQIVGVQLAAKVTGMLLQVADDQGAVDEGAVLAMLEEPELLRTRALEALELLESVQPVEAA